MYIRSSERNELEKCLDVESNILKHFNKFIDC